MNHNVLTGLHKQMHWSTTSSPTGSFKVQKTYLCKHTIRWMCTVCMCMCILQVNIKCPCGLICCWGSPHLSSQYLLLSQFNSAGGLKSIDVPSSKKHETKRQNWRGYTIKYLWTEKNNLLLKPHKRYIIKLTNCQKTCLTQQTSRSCPLFLLWQQDIWSFSSIYV